MGLSQFFMLIEFALKAMNWWESFLDYLAEKHADEVSARAAARNAAVDAGKLAQADGEIWAAQEDVSKNLPQP